MTSERSPRLSPSGARLSCDPGCLSGASGVGCCPGTEFTNLVGDAFALAGVDPPTILISQDVMVAEATDTLDIQGIASVTGDPDEGVVQLLLEIDGTMIDTTRQTFGIGATPEMGIVQHVVTGLSPGLHTINFLMSALGTNAVVRAATASGENASLKTVIRPAP